MCVHDFLSLKTYTFINFQTFTRKDEHSTAYTYIISVQFFCCLHISKWIDFDYNTTFNHPNDLTVTIVKSIHLSFLHATFPTLEIRVCVCKRVWSKSRKNGQQIGIYREKCLCLVTISYRSKIKWFAKNWCVSRKSLNLCVWNWAWCQNHLPITSDDNAMLVTPQFDNN